MIIFGKFVGGWKLFPRIERIYTVYRPAYTFHGARHRIVVEFLLKSEIASSSQSFFGKNKKKSEKLA
jgi:hypothetical protein